jgi:hypothetical protein
MVEINVVNFVTVGIMAMLFWVLVHWVFGLFGAQIPGVSPK